MIALSKDFVAGVPPKIPTCKFVQENNFSIRVFSAIQGQLCIVHMHLLARDFMHRTTERTLHFGGNVDRGQFNKESTRVFFF